MTAPEKHKTKKFKNCFNYYVELKQIVEQINVLQKILSAIIPKKKCHVQEVCFCKKIVLSISQMKNATKMIQIRIVSPSLQLRTYTGEVIHPIGKAIVNISFNNKNIISELYNINANVDSII